MCNAVSSGYVLVAPQESTYTYLIDSSGNVVHAWKSAYSAGLAATLTEDGHLYRAGKGQNDHMIHGSGGVIEEYDWDGNLVWQYYYSDSQDFQHHDFTVLPNGDVLFIAAEVIPASEAIALGRNPLELRDGVLLADKLVEVRPQGLHGAETVWQWRAIDHVIQDEDPAKANYGTVAAHPERIDFNYQGRAIFPDGWTHINSVDYNPDTDQVLVSVRNYNEIWIINHDATTAEAAGAAGDLLYRWGNPQAYGAGSASDQQLFGQHDAKWIRDGLPGAGDILIFDNGVDRPQGAYSRAVEIAVPTPAPGRYALTANGGYGPAAPTWTYVSPVPATLYSDKMGGAQRLPDGDTLLTVGETGQLLEVTPGGQTNWSYDTNLSTLELARSRSEGAVFYATWYPADSPAVSNGGLMPEDPALGALARYGTARMENAAALSSRSGKPAWQILAGNAV